jgi:hypothetical protein
LGLSRFYAATTPIGGYGDRPMPIDKKCILWHVGGNVNGTIPINNDKGMTAMAGNLRGLQAGSISMIETNVEWKHFQYRETTNRLLNKTFGEARVEFCTSYFSFEGRYKPGGTATAALVNWCHIVVGSGRDPTGCGRWSYVTYDGKGIKLITYVSAYRVCNQTNRGNVKLLPLPQPSGAPARKHGRTNPSAQRATQLRSVLAHVYAVSIQNQITTTVP